MPRTAPRGPRDAGFSHVHFASIDVENVEDKVLETADLGLKPNEVKRVMAEGDINGDGEVSYEEFIPLAVDLVQSMYARMEAEAQRTEDEDQAREQALHRELKLRCCTCTCIVVSCAHRWS